MKKYHILYKTVRPLTGEYYYGIHSTNNLYDGYQGSGEKLLRKMKCSDIFITGIVSLYESREELEMAERELINDTMLQDTLCLNIAYGGSGSMYNRSHTTEAKAKMKLARNKRITTDETRKKMTEAHKGKKMEPRTDEARFKRSNGKYVVDGITYVSSNVAAKALGCDGATIRNRCRSESLKFQNYIFIPKQNEEE